MWPTTRMQKSLLNGLAWAPVAENIDVLAMGNCWAARTSVCVHHKIHFEQVLFSDSQE